MLEMWQQPTSCTGAGHSLNFDWCQMSTLAFLVVQQWSCWKESFADTPSRYTWNYFRSYWLGESHSLSELQGHQLHTHLPACGPVCTVEDRLPGASFSLIVSLRAQAVHKVWLTFRKRVLIEIMSQWRKWKPPPMLPDHFFLICRCVVCWCQMRRSSLLHVSFLL